MIVIPNVIIYGIVGFLFTTCLAIIAWLVRDKIKTFENTIKELQKEDRINVKKLNEKIDLTQNFQSQQEKTIIKMRSKAEMLEQKVDLKMENYDERSKVHEAQLIKNTDELSVVHRRLKNGGK